MLDDPKSTWVFKAEVKGIDPSVRLNYRWKYRVGGKENEIKSGQNTSEIFVENADTKLGILVFLTVEGIPTGCNNGVGISAID